MIWHVLLILFITWLYVLQCKRKKIFYLAKKLKNDIQAWPLIGHAYMMLGDSEERMRALQSLGRETLKQGGMTSVWLGHRFFIMISEPVAADICMRNCLEKHDIVLMSQYVVGNGSIFAPVSLWRHRRRMLVPTFNHRNLTDYVQVFAKHSNIMVDQLKPKVGKGTFSIWSYLTTYSMDSVCETTLGVRLHTQRNRKQPFLKAFEEFCDLITSRMCQPWFHSDFIYKHHPDFKRLTQARDCMYEFINETIKLKRMEVNANQEKLQTSMNNNKSRNYKSFVELLITPSDDYRGYSDLELQEESLMMVMAGTDTTAVGAAFTFIMLSWYQDIQEKVYEELKEVFGDSSRPVEPKDLPQLKYLEAVIRETIRLYPPVPMSARTVTSEVTLPSGLILPKDCGVMVHFWALHRNQKYWGADAEHFRPERFLDIKFKHPAQFATFGIGSRNCVGYNYAMMSIKTVLATTLRQYRIVAAYLPASYEDGKPVYKPLRLKIGIMMKDIDNFLVQLVPR